MNLIKYVAAPLARRVGSTIAGGMAAVGIQGDQATAIMAGLVALAGVGFDLLTSYADKKGWF